MQPMGLRVVLSTEETDLILRRGLLTFDTVASVPSFAHDQTNFGGEASGGGMLKLIYLCSKAKGIVIPVGRKRLGEVGPIIVSVCDVELMADIVLLR